jgi:hypothetical protein
MDRFTLKRRADAVAAIRDAEFLDAVFLQYYFNKHDHPNWSGLPRITIDEAFAAYDQAKFAICLERAVRLLEASTSVGAAGHASNEAHLEAIDAMKQSNPGFSQACYAKVIALGWAAKR